MRLHTVLAAALLAALVTPSAGAAAGAVALLPAAEGDLVAPAASSAVTAAAKSAPMLPAADIERAPVQFAWALDAGEPLHAPSPYVAESREFHTELEAAELARGHALDLSAPGAVLRISPLDGAKAALAPEAIELLRGGKRLPAEAIEHAATAAQLKAAGMELGEGTLAFRIAPSAGEGRITLRSDSARGRYLLHVYEPASPYSATLATAAHDAFAGGSLDAFVDLREAGRSLVADAVRGALAAPDGRVFDVAFRLDAAGGGRAAISLPTALPSVPGLWELHAFVAGEDGGRRVLRDVKTSFAVAAPTARLAGSVRASWQGGGFRAALPLEVAAPGRYELRAVLYGTAPDGTLQPLASAHSARWLDTDGAVELSFPAGLLQGSGLRAPYELRELALSDQSRLARLETRARALVVAPPAPARGGEAPR